MPRPTGPKTRCGGAWTESKFITFVKNQLRQGTRKWAPIQSCLRNAKVARGIYLCAGCDEEVPVTVVDEEKRKRVKNVFVDHISPIVDPSTGFTDWNSFIENLFCEEDNLQVLCKECHDTKTKLETSIATERRRREKLEQ